MWRVDNFIILPYLQPIWLTENTLLSLKTKAQQEKKNHSWFNVPYIMELMRVF